MHNQRLEVDDFRTKLRAEVLDNFRDSLDNPGRNAAAKSKREAFILKDS